MPPGDGFLAPGLGRGDDALRVAAEFEHMGLTARVKARGVVESYGQRMETRVKAKASGRPGPNAPTGDYRRHIAHHTVFEGPEVAGYCGTNKPQGRRLELGFVGPDSEGRVFPFRPYPHFGPAWDEIMPTFPDDVADAVMRED